VAEDHPPRRLSRDMRSALIAGVKKRQCRRRASRRNSDRWAQKGASFEDLPGFEAIRLQQSLAGKIGIPVPFYRLHEARAGTETVIGGQPCYQFHLL
jgi:hypothetical protein